MKLDINFWRAVEEYRMYVDKIVRTTRMSEKEKTEKLSLESFAIWLAQEWPRFAEARK